MAGISLSTGLDALDSLLGEVRPGDNIVWLVPSVREYRAFVKPFVGHAAEEGFKLVYVSIDGSLGDMMRRGAKTFDASFGSIQELTRGINALIDEEGMGTHYVFDSLSLLKSQWGERR